MVFVQSFGLDTSKCNGIDTCNFVSMLENRKILKEIDERMARWEKEYLHNGHRILNEFAKCENAPHAEPWIKDKLTQKEAGILWETLRNDARLTKELIDLIPRERTYDTVQNVSSGGKYTSIFGGFLVGAGVLLAPFTAGVTEPLAVGAAGTVVGTGGLITKVAVDNKADNHKALRLARDTVENKILKETKLETILKKLLKLKPRLAKKFQIC